MAGFDNRRVTDRTDNEVKATAEVMLLANQPRAIGVLYGTHCYEPHLVPIPYVKTRQSEAEFAEAPSLTLDALFVECWVPHTRSAKRQDRVTEKMVPGQSVLPGDSEEMIQRKTLAAPFTVYFTNQDNWQQQKQNEAVTRAMYMEQREERGRRQREMVWHGPILVVKHSKGTEEPMDISEDDLPLVWNVLKQAMKCYHFSQDEHAPFLSEQQWG
ncbi:hypothetical protein HGRIS_011123 [Hohenbuehelia grisea]|uniref:Uncharacterized protein n=1 Tax=Hohenbuehelia grisea TaxID=104357 RepID=A0ABR3IZ63_9AGAR